MLTTKDRIQGLYAVFCETEQHVVLIDELIKLAISCGAMKATMLPQEQVVVSADFRDICISNACGNFDKCYMCPPDVGDIKELIKKVRAFDTAVMYQSVYEVEDSFDFEGMQSAGAAFNRTSRKIRARAGKIIRQPWLHLAAGGCRNCTICAKRDQLPCRMPSKALASLEAYGIDVYQTATHAGLRYIHGANTVTYFGMLLF